MANTTKLTVSVPVEVAEFLDQQARERQQSRSAIVSAWLEEKRKEVFEAELAQAYMEMADDLEQFAREILPMEAEMVMKYAPYDESDED